MPIISHKKIATTHGATGCAQPATAGVLEGFSWTEQGLLTNHTQTFDIIAVTALVLNHPVARNQLNGNTACVGDRDGVGERKQTL